MLTVALRNNGDIRYVTAFLDCWNVRYVLGKIEGNQYFLGVMIGEMHREVYDALTTLLIPFEPIDVAPLFRKLAV